MNKIDGILTLAVLGVIGYVAYSNWGALKTIGGSLNTKVSGAINSIADAAKE